MNSKVKTQKVTLSLDGELLIKMAKRAKKTRSAFVRDLIQREADQLKNNFSISTEILELKGSLKGTEASSKARIKDATMKKLRRYERL